MRRLLLLVAVLAGCEGKEARDAREAIAQLEKIGLKHESDSTASAAALATPTGRWNLSEGKSPMDDSKTVTISLNADSVIRRLDRPRTPQLFIRCKERETDVYVVNGMSADVEYGLSDQATVRLRYDSLPAVTRVWNESTDDDALFAPSAIALARKLHSTNKLTYQFTPYGAPPQITTFTLHGIRELLPKVAETCGWKI